MAHDRRKMARTATENGSISLVRARVSEAGAVPSCVGFVAAYWGLLFGGFCGDHGRALLATRPQTSALMSCPDGNGRGGGGPVDAETPGDSRGVFEAADRATGAVSRRGQHARREFPEFPPFPPFPRFPFPSSPLR